VSSDEVSSVSDDSHKKSGCLPEWVSCKHSIDRIFEFLDGSLPEEERMKVDRHFKLCPPCREFLGKYRAVPGLCQKALVQELPRETADRLTTFLRDKLKGC
jgi:anti-sigma factor RsiW